MYEITRNGLLHAILDTVEAAEAALEVLRGLYPADQWK